MANSEATAGPGSPRCAWVQVAWLLLAAVTGLMVLCPLVARYNFFDGLIYASVARNMAEGIGPLASPRFSATLFPVFTEHPPLMMWLESLGFRLFGDTIAVEKTFSLLLLILSGALSTVLWRRINRDDAVMRAAAPLALLLTIIAGRLAWGFASNMLENLVIPLTLLAVWMGVEGSFTTPEKPRRRLLWLTGSALAVLLAVFTKGPVGLFPLATPALAWIVFRHVPLRIAVLDTLVLMAAVAGALALVMLDQDARAYAALYVDQKLGGAFTGMRGESGPFWRRVLTLLRMVFYPALVAGLLYGLCRALKLDTRPQVSAELLSRRWRRAIFLALVGFSASAPITLSPLIFSFYFSPSLPFYAMALAYPSVPMLGAIAGRLPAASARWAMRASITAVLIVGLAIGLNFGRPGREAAVMGDVDRIAAEVCGAEGGACPESIAVCEPLWVDWQLHAYFERYYRIALGKAPDADNRYLLANADCASAVPQGYVETAKDLSTYRLFMRR